jgi:hypothetical protein
MANEMQKPFEPLQSKSSPGMLSSADSCHKTKKNINIYIYVCVSVGMYIFVYSILFMLF